MGENRSPSSTSLERILKRSKMTSLRHDVFDFKDRLCQQVQRLKEKRSGLLEHLQEAEAERDRLSLGLSRHAWRQGLFYAPLSGLGKAAEEGARRIQQLRSEKRALGRKLQEVQRREEKAECEQKRAEQWLSSASQTLAARRQQAEGLASLTTELRAVADDTEAALAAGRRRREALAHRLRLTERAVERAMTVNGHMVHALQMEAHGRCTALKALQLRVKLLEMEHQLERQRALWGDDAVICQPTSMELMEREVHDVQQLQKQLSCERLCNQERDSLYEKSKERVRCLQNELHEMRADVQERLAVVDAGSGLEAAWQAEQAVLASRLEAASAGSAAQAAAEGALDCALRRSVTSAGAAQAELRGRNGELRALSSVAASLLPDEQSAIPTVKEYLGARHYYGLVLAAKAQREQMLSAIQNMSSRLREADARSKQLREALLADRRLLAAMEAQLELAKRTDTGHRPSSAAQAALVRTELLEAEVLARETAVALASQETLRLELGCTREAVRVRRLYEQALGVVLCRPSPDHCDTCPVCGSCGDHEACVLPTT